MSKEDIPEQKLRVYGSTPYKAAARTAVIAGLFCLIVAGFLGGNCLWTRIVGPRKEASLEALKKQLIDAPDNEKLRNNIRSLDLELRQAYVRNREFARKGAWLLLTGAVVFLAALRYAISYRGTLPEPGRAHAERGEEKRAAMFARWSVAGVAVVLLAGGVSAAFIPPQQTPKQEKAPEKRKPAQKWPRFRGPGGLGISAYTNVPSRWDGRTGEGILWKIELPLPGENSPVVWGDRVFLSGATETQREVYCFDANTGKLLWRRRVQNIPGSPAEAPKVMDVTGYAAPTTTTDGRRVFAIFANGDLAAFDFDGNLAWAKSLGLPDNNYGHASSLTTYRGLLIVQFDQGGGDDAKSAILAFDAATGELAWKAKRAMPNSWCSPIVIQVGQRAQLIASGTPWVVAYDPGTGAEIWRAKCLDGEIGPSPTFAGGLVFVAQDGASLAAIRPDGTGDVTDTHVAWTAGGNLPNTASPLSNGELIFLANGSMVTCHDAKNKGNMLWEHDFDHTFNSSPTLVGDKVYLMDEKGIMHIFKAAREFELVGEAALGEDANSSPAFLDGRIYIRGKKHLFCIGKADVNRRTDNVD